MCGLDRPNLLDLYNEHVNHTVRAKLESFFAAVAKDDTQAAFKAWETARRGLLARGLFARCRMMPSACSSPRGYESAIG